MGRPSKASVALGSIEEVSEAMGELLLTTLQLKGLIIDRDGAVALVQKGYEKPIDVARGRVAGLEAALEDYYYAHIVEIEKDGVKHLDCANGRMGRRTNPEALAPLNKSWTWKRIRELVQAVYQERFRLEPKFEIDRDKIKAELVVEELKQLGLKIEQGETFYVEPAQLPGVEG